MARMWPSDAIAANRVKFQAICEQIVVVVPRAAIAADQAYRGTNLATDFCKDVRPLERNAIDQIVRLMIDTAMKISSIHVNGWFGAYDKMIMIRQLFDEVLHIYLDQEKKAFCLCRRSRQRQSCFLIKGRAWDGFVELTSHLVAD